MDYYTISKEYIPDLKDNLMDNIVANINNQMSDDLKAAIIAGCKIDTIVIDNKITVKTHYPISILKDDKGRILHIYEKKV